MQMIIVNGATFSLQTKPGLHHTKYDEMVKAGQPMAP